MTESRSVEPSFFCFCLFVVVSLLFSPKLYSGNGALFCDIIVNKHGA